MIKKIPVIFRQTPVIDRRRCAVEPCSCQRRLTRLACTRLQEAGLGPVQLLARAGLTIEQIKDHRARVSVACQIRLLTLAASAIDDELLGFHLAPACDLRELGLIEAPAQAAPLMVRAACSGSTGCQMQRPCAHRRAASCWYADANTPSLFYRRPVFLDSTRRGSRSCRGRYRARMPKLDPMAVVLHGGRTIVQ